MIPFTLARPPFALALWRRRDRPRPPRSATARAIAFVRVPRSGCWRRSFRDPAASRRGGWGDTRSRDFYRRLTKLRHPAVVHVAGERARRTRGMPNRTRKRPGTNVHHHHHPQASPPRARAREGPRDHFPVLGPEAADDRNGRGHVRFPRPAKRSPRRLHRAGRDRRGRAPPAQPPRLQRALLLVRGDDGGGVRHDGSRRYPRWRRHRL